MKNKKLPADQHGPWLRVLSIFVLIGLFPFQWIWKILIAAEVWFEKFSGVYEDTKESY
jgi:hypothetical protein